MGRVKICHIITDLSPAGAELATLDVVRRLNPQRYQSHVIGLRSGSLAHHFTRAGIDVRCLDVRGKWDIMKLPQLAGLLGEIQPDIVHTHLFHADFVGRLAARLAGIKNMIHTVHTPEGRFKPWRYTFVRMQANVCQRIVCVSPAVYTEHRRRTGLPTERYTIIPNGIDISRYTRDPQAGRTLRQRLGIPDGEVLLGYIGRLHREKGTDILLGAMSHLGARQVPMNLVIAGDGPMRPLVKNFIEHGEGGRLTHLLGFVEDITEVLSAIDVLVMPSRWEGFGRAAAEAMAAGVPVLASRTSGLADLIVDGDSGMLVEPKDVVHLAEGLETIAADADLRTRLARSGRQRVERHFRIDQVVSAHEQLYEDVLAGRANTSPQPENLWT